MSYIIYKIAKEIMIKIESEQITNFRQPKSQEKPRKRPFKSIVSMQKKKSLVARRVYEKKSSQHRGVWNFKETLRYLEFIK